MPEILAALSILSLVWAMFAYYQHRARRRAFQDRMKARWRILVESNNGTTAVYIFRDVDSTVMDRILVARVPHTDPEWTSKVQAARAEAEERIATLETTP